MGLADTIKRLITKHGRSVTLKKLSRTPTTSAKPWRGTGTTDDPDVTTTAFAVFIDYKNSEIDGEMIKAGDLMALVAAISGVDLREYNVLTDGTEEWSIMDVELIKPGTIEFLYKIQLRRR